MYHRFSRIRKPIRNSIRTSILWAAFAGLLLIGGRQMGFSDAGSALDGGAYASLSLPLAQVPLARAVSAPQAKVDSSAWPVARGSLNGVAYSYKYPVGWGADLTYCAPGAAVAGITGQHLPKGCVSTDFLVGKKARDVGRIAGDAFDVGGKAGVRVVQGAPQNALVSQVYTLMVYESDGSPLFGLVAMVGPDTSRAVRDQVTASLDGVADTLRVEK